MAKTESSRRCHIHLRLIATATHSAFNVVVVVVNVVDDAVLI